MNCVCPGTFRSAIHEGLPPRRSTRSRPGTRWARSAADLVGAYSYLAGDDSRWTTGSAMVVDGGYSAP